MFFGLDILLSCVSFQRYTTTQRSLGRETMEEQSVHHGLQDSGTSGWLIWDVTSAYDGYGMMDRHLCLLTNDVYEDLEARDQCSRGNA